MAVLTGNTLAANTLPLKMHWPHNICHITYREHIVIVNAIATPCACHSNAPPLDHPHTCHLKYFKPSHVCRCRLVTPVMMMLQIPNVSFASITNLGQKLVVKSVKTTAVLSAMNLQLTAPNSSSNAKRGDPKVCRNRRAGCVVSRRCCTRSRSMGHRTLDPAVVPNALVCIPQWPEPRLLHTSEASVCHHALGGFAHVCYRQINASASAA